MLINYLNKQILGDIFVLVSSINHPQSVEQMIEIYRDIEECKMGRRTTTTASQNNINPIPIVFVLNKIDLPTYKWEIQVNEAKNLLAKAIPNFNPNDCFIECSALNNENILRVNRHSKRIEN